VSNTLAPVPQFQDPIDPTTRKMRREWVDWLHQLKVRAETAAGPGGTIDASQITSGTIALARLAGITNAQIAAAAAIVWSKIDKAGSSLADIAVRSASDLSSGLLALARGGTGADLSGTGGTSQYLKQAAAGAAVTVGTIAAADLPTGIDAAKIADGSVSNAEFQYIGGLTSDAQTQLDRRMPVVLYRKHFSYVYSGPIGSGPIVGMGLANATITAAGHSEASTATFFGASLTTSAVIANAVVVAGAVMLPTITDPVAYVRIKTGADITNVRIFFALSNAAFSNADAFNAQYVGFRYSTVVPDGGWVGVCCDGAAANAQTTGTVAAIAASTEYLLRIRVSGDGTAVNFAVSTAGGAFSAEQTLSANLPATNVRLRWEMRVTTQAAAAKAFAFNSAYVESEDGA